ncbi:hypothetical protein [Nocardioides jishulii]|uniref:Uncharacterized protein n=1 Tax=Nocardioides jishulii TaxID=2575440 RepID=A0A4U2YLV5_9ACTN|nr:hypothetical protein [Nocardioides jishulii]QCX28067.1 hypothetical protein FCL41_11480 [Nocardioides jishulii]TKI60731.1 hypothetical protein FC770_14555 [Nocardioides jishulii]
MTDARVRPWLLEALAHGSASPLDVARLTWQRHEAEIRSAGDLLYTWQLDLQECAAAMARDGSLLVDPDGRWALTGVTPSPGRDAWREDEIVVAVAAYVALLRAEHTGQPLRTSSVIADVLARTGRTSSQLDALMANISAVVQEHGYAPLSSYPPRSNVPRGVRPAVAAALEA